jgi:uncharacterized protein
MSADFVQATSQRIDLPWAAEAADYVVETMRQDGSHDGDHLLRVMRNSDIILEGERKRGSEADREVVMAAALFHDVINVPKDSDKRADASVQAAETARHFFEGTGAFDTTRLEWVADAIERHSYSRGLEPKRLEGAIVRDADRLEAIGAVGLARCFHVGGQLDRPLWDQADPFAEDRDLDDTQYAIDHFFEKLLTIREHMQTETGAEIADRRHGLLTDYLKQLADEVGADWPPARLDALRR